MIDFLKEARKIEPEIIETRRQIHRRPELAYKEKATSKLVAEKLRSFGLEVRTGIGGTGVLGILRGLRKGGVVGLRADMDALPIEEMADVEFRSKEKGVMHACGHDTHVAMLLGTAKLLADHREDLAGIVKFFFQPAEEHGGRGGAKPMIQEGVMENPKVDFVFGLHIVGDVESGVTRSISSAYDRPNLCRSAIDNRAPRSLRQDDRSNPANRHKRWKHSLRH